MLEEVSENSIMLREHGYKCSCFAERKGKIGVLIICRVSLL